MDKSTDPEFERFWTELKTFAQDRIDQTLVKIKDMDLTDILSKVEEVIPKIKQFDTIRKYYVMAFIVNETKSHQRFIRELENPATREAMKSFIDFVSVMDIEEEMKGAREIYPDVVDLDDAQKGIVLYYVFKILSITEEYLHKQITEDKNTDFNIIIIDGNSIRKY